MLSETTGEAVVGSVPHDRSAAIRRAVTDLAREYSESFRVLVLNGPRQSGKTTIMRMLMDGEGDTPGTGGTFLNLDRVAMLEAARSDPAGFATLGEEPRYIDEVQRAGDELILEIKASVDEDPRPGRYVLAGSTSFFGAPTLSESLAGRVGVLRVWPFSRSELTGTGQCLIDTAFEDPDALRRLAVPVLDREDYFRILCTGGFPAAVEQKSERARNAWFDNYVTAVIERDIRDMARVNEPSAAATILRLLAARTSQEIVLQDLHTKTGLSRETVTRYISLLEAVFLVHRLPVWSRNLTTRMVKNPKTHLVDTGLAAYLLGVTPRMLARPVSPERGPLVETFVYTELAKLATWSDTDPRLYHFRDRNGAEVDLILEDRAGRVLGVECKAAGSVNEADFRHLVFLRDKLGDEFRHGIVFYLGGSPLPFGDRLTALPLGALWAQAAR